MEKRKPKHWNHNAQQPMNGGRFSQQQMNGGYFSHQPMMHGGFNGPKGMSALDQDTRQFYYLGENLGSEDRNLEFKAGAGFLNHGYHENVSKYICAFANSQGNGKLLLGVNNDGEVVGYDCSHHEEDLIRRNTDAAIKDITPPIFPQRYTVRFVPVVNQYQEELGNKKVIEISLNGQQLQIHDVLFSTSKGVYQRRDGGTHELKPYEIQEWARQRYNGEIEKLKKNEQNLQSELQSRHSNNRQLEEKLLEKNKELNQRSFEIEKLKYEIEKQQRENNRLAEEMQELHNQSKSEQGNEDQNQQMLEILGQIREQTAMSKKQKKSKVCTIS